MRTDAEERKFGLILVAFGAVTLLLHLLTNGRYGYFRDELYYIACARHLDWGYVDMAPLSALVLRIELALFGQSLLALRLFPAVAGGLTVALTGLIARELGGRAWSMILACTASLSALVYLGIGNFYSMNVFEPLFWMGCAYLLIRILNGDSPKLWLWFGVIAGFGVENKHSFAFFGIGL
nr:glycosyltransferase family 39 protein [Verrucomicrobiota bacterium]